jgi:hydrogenase maturation protein HypF
MQRAMKVYAKGRVQGVGFRPFIFQLARKYNIRGTVQNNMDGVKVLIEGEGKSLQLFLEALQSNTPRLSKITEITFEPVSSVGYTDFRIIPSIREGASTLVLPVDSAICQDCIREMEDPSDSRYQYPFINCTQCGPRYTIISELPYDRAYTSMKHFRMCPACQAEYEDPANRRHHAQPIACPRCGPSMELLNSNREIIFDHPLIKTRQLLKDGAIIAVKGLGGFHLCCDAANEEAVAKLRERKRRPTRPLAVMARDIKAVKEIALCNNVEIELLSSPEAPIVLLRKKEPSYIPASIAPGMGTLGIMLPYTPLHHLLFKDTQLRCLVMTSANPTGLPILYDDQHAITFLKGIADYILLNNRRILHPIDDSVIEIKAGRTDFFRRARGYAPEPITLKRDVHGIVAFGGQQKSVFTIGRNNQAIVGPHIGDLGNLETTDRFQTELQHLLSWIQIPYMTGAIDFHPHYTSREIAKNYPFREIIEVQHHHAHMVSCMADNQLEGDVWGIILDGTGYGFDGNIWGFEILHGNESDFSRIAHLKYTPLPGSEKAIKEPWRNAAAMLIDLLGNEGDLLAQKLFPEKEFELDFIKSMLRNKINSPLGGSCGRLFDAVSAIIGICEYSSYEGEAAIKLSELARECTFQEPSYPYRITNRDGLYIFDFSLTLKSIAYDYLDGQEAARINSRFHETVVSSLVSGLVLASKSSRLGTRRVVLSGGSFHNNYLVKRIKEELLSREFDVYAHNNIPCNDGGLSFGQLVAAEAMREDKKCV